MTSQVAFSGDLYEVDKRLLVEGDRWYARTRETPKLGPYGNRDEAVAGLYEHVARFGHRPRPSFVDSAHTATIHRIDGCDTPNCALCDELSLLQNYSMPRAQNQ
ncbi:MAG: hypothetical protein R3175_08770 [Marinobacter sp.]|uniref:hypothetical protein n=1 Tax=Marinobacter sp. TaxID=50741 RepID=UPI00299E36FC|nr:hypothetical protein [Marinobacter sp.]MDX1756136.1 hypothetical protein [Marinobacter sp.]